MSEILNTTTIEQLAKRLKEPSWVTELRRAALTQHGKLPWPNPSDEIWRRTKVSLLDPMEGFSLVAAPSLQQSIRLSDAQAAQFIHPLADESLLVRADGAWINREAPRGVLVADLAEAASEQGSAIRSAIEADGLTSSEQKLASLNTAFHHDDVFIKLEPNTSLASPLRLVHLLSAQPKAALFPLSVIVVGGGSSVVLIDEYVGLSAASAEEPHVVNGRVELVVEPNASVHYVRIQRWNPAAREFVLLRTTLKDGAKFTMVNINIGASLSKAHVITKLLGPRASSKLYGFVFGHGAQHVDQHTLQDHQAPHTVSDLLFNAALKDRSRMVYTGLIRIAKSAKQTDAYQANHNLLLSQDAKAETIPMLEILADDVRCKHGATIGPVDEEQVFYAMTRGIPQELAERLIVMGFVEQVIQQVPYEPLQERLRQEIESGLHGQGQGAGGEGRVNAEFGMRNLE